MTSPTDKIPGDIMTKAEAVYDMLGRGSTADAEIIARAIMAERERAAKIVETFYLSPEPTSRAARYHLKHCVRPVFASAIRGGR